MTDATLRRRDGAIQSPRLVVALGSRGDVSVAQGGDRPAMSAAAHPSGSGAVQTAEGGAEALGGDMRDRRRARALQELRASDRQ